MVQAGLKPHWDEDSFVLVRSLFTPEETGRFRDHFMAWNASERKEDFDRVDPTGKDPLAQYPRIVHPHRRDTLSMDFMLDPRLKGAMLEFLGSEPLAAQTMFYFKPPLARGQALHQDQQYLRAEPGTCIAAWLAIDDFDEENGCLQVVPKSQELPLLCHVPADTSVSFTSQTIPVPDGFAPTPVLMKSGDVLFFHGSLIHGSGPNLSSTRFRRALIGHYVSGDARRAAKFYHPLLRFDGTVVELETSPSGGACGIVTENGIEMVSADMPGPTEPH